MMTVGVRELKNNLSKYVRDAERGKRVAVTAHGRIVAELVPPGPKRQSTTAIRPALEDGDPFEGLDPTPLLKPGEALAILDWLREDK